MSASTCWRRLSDRASSLDSTDRCTSSSTSRSIWPSRCSDCARCIERRRWSTVLASAVARRPSSVRNSRLSSTSCTATSTAFCQTSTASSARADCARMPASMRPALKMGVAKASATFEKCTGARSSAFRRRSWRPSRALRKSLGHHCARASAPRSVSAAMRASAAIRSGRRLSSSLGCPVPISRAAGHAKPAASSTTRAEGLRPSSTASRVCEMPASTRSAGTCASSASASARARSRSKALASPSRRRLPTRPAVSCWAAASACTMRRRSCAPRRTKYCRATSLATRSRAPSTPAAATAASACAASRAARTPPARSISQATSTPARSARVSGMPCLTGAGSPLSLREADACRPTVGHRRDPWASLPARAWATRCSAMLTSWLVAKASSTSAVSVGSP